MKNVFPIILCLLLAYSCGNMLDNSSGATNTQAEAQNPEATEKIELNNGEKWVVNEEMKPFIQKGEDLVQLYIQDEKTDYKSLAQQVKEQNSLLIKSCTMEGKSHDELHKWLHPHLELAEELEQAENEEESKQIVQKLKHSYQQYHSYFK